MRRLDLSRPRKAYHLRCRGMSWKNIAKQLGYKTYTGAQSSVASYVGRLGLTYPKVSAVGKYERAIELRKTGMGWKRIAWELGYNSANSVRGALANFCKKNGEPLPKPNNNKHKACYEAALNTNKSWGQIGKENGYSDHAGPCRAARSHALRNGLKWPIRQQRKGTKAYG